MNLPYLQVIDFPKHQFRKRVLPWIRIGIFNPQNPEKIIDTVGLIDSGAEITILDREIGENLGYRVEKGIKEELRGLGGGTIPGFTHKVGFIIEDPDNTVKQIKYIDFAVFAKNPFPATMPQQTAIYGTVGFFQHLMVTFIFPSQITIDLLSS